MDVEIAALKNAMPPLRSSLKAHTTKLSIVKSSLSTSELQALISNLRVSNAEKRERLEGFKNGAVKQGSKEEVVRVEKEFKYWGKMMMKRRKAYEELEDKIIDGMGKGREEIREELGVEV
jgi:hypothetical protein